MTQSSREAHPQLICDLLTRLYGKRDLIVASQALKATGCDDANEPYLRDHWEKL